MLPISIVGQTGRRPLPQSQAPDLSTQDILRQLRQSGLTRDQARRRLQALGYDPALVDPYFDQLEGGSEVTGPVPTEFREALAAMGLLQVGLGVDSLAVTTDSARVRPDSLETEEEEGLRVFGLDIFRSPTGQFDPVVTGPVDPAYRLGPGDQLTLVLTGDVELAYTLEVSREGFIVIPDVGQVGVNGLTLAQLRETLFRRLGRVYSGVREGPDATTFFDVSLGRLRANQVFVVGDVAAPGAYQISSVGTVLTALYAAGGPTENGSFREVVVRRAGQPVTTLDLYDYLLRGDASNDIRLDQGDVVFVPPASGQVTVEGAVRRPAIYEVAEGEELEDLLEYAGGLLPGAAASAIRIERLLPPAQRQPGIDRVVLSADLTARSDDPDSSSVQVIAGDHVTVPAAIDEVRRRVAITGAVNRPGRFQWQDGLTLGQLLDRAQLADNAVRQGIQVFRPVPGTGGYGMFRASADAPGTLGRGLRLADRDSVVVFAVDSILVPDSISVEGMVRNAGRYAFADGMSAEDAILMAGGIRQGGVAFRAEIARLVISADRSDTVSVPIEVRIDELIPDPLRLADRPTGWEALPPSGTVPLQPNDRVFIRELPGFEPPMTVFVSGEVIRPGAYAVERRDERISDLVERIGGFTDEAYIPGARVVRDSLVVGINLVEAVASPGGEDDIRLEHGDQLIVPGYDPTVAVRGAVNFETRAVFERGLGVDEYIAQAGGTLEHADLDRLSVEYANGRRDTPSKFLWWRSYPRVEPGATIFVPEKDPDSGIGVDVILSRTLSIVGTLGTLIITIDRLGN